MKNRSRAIPTQLLAHLILAPIGLIWIYPFLWMVSTSLKTPDQMFGSGLNLIPSPLVLENYKRAWVVANFSGYFLNTVILAVATVTIVLLLTSTAGYVLGRYDFPGKKLFIGLIIATTIIPTGYTIIPVFDLIKRLGLLNTRIGVILAESGGAHVAFLLLFAGYFAQIPKEIEEAAIIDGCSFPQLFARIMFPLATPVIGTVVIFQFISSWKSFFIPLVFTFGNPALRTLGVGMFSFMGEHTFDWTGLAAGASISLIPVMIVFLFFQRYFIEGLVGAIKG